MPQSPEEIFDVVDSTDQVIGKAPRSQVHSIHLLHRAVHVLLFDSSGALVVQKRSATKDTYPGCYDSSASGHLNAGEDYDAAAARETQEELGVLLPVGALQKQFKIEACADTGWEFVWVYIGPATSIMVPNPDEVESVTALSRTQIESLLATQPESCARSFRRVLNEIFKRGSFPAQPLPDVEV